LEDGARTERDEYGECVETDEHGEWQRRRRRRERRKRRTGVERRMVDELAFVILGVALRKTHLTKIVPTAIWRL